MCAGLLFLALSLSAAARPLEAMFWNLESPGHDVHAGDKKTADLDFLCRRIEADFAGADVVGFAEVEPDWGPALESALEKSSGADFELHLSETGGHDRLALAWRRDRFRCAEVGPIDSIGGPFVVGSKRLRFRPSLYARLQTEKGSPLVLVVNHFARSQPATGPGARRQQAHVLRHWLQQIQDPVLCLGDFNFDYHIREGDRDHAGYSVLTQDDLFHWVRYPDPLVPTQGECQDGKPASRFESILDFIFTANSAQQWPARGEVLTRPDDFCPESENSDHRPVRARFEAP
jgi:endonuclease/exonuclease/phosphatase family metal-dependent hydrolase